MAENEVLQALRRLIEQRAGESDGRLPSERELAGQLQVSRGLVRKYLIKLADEGLLVPRTRSGWRVTGQAIGEPPQTLIGFSEMAAMYGYSVRSEVLGRSLRLGSEAEHEALRLDEFARVLELVRRRWLDDRAVSVETTVLPLHRAERLVEADLTDRSLFAELEHAGQLVGHTDMVVEATAAREPVASQLELSVGDPMLLVHEKCFDEFGAPLFVGRAHYRHDSYRVRTSLWRRARQRPSSGVGRA